MHVIHFTVNICTCSEKVKYELKKNEISQLFKAKIFVFFTQETPKTGLKHRIFYCVFFTAEARRFAETFRQEKKTAAFYGDR